MKHPLTLFAALVATALFALTLSSCRDTLPAGPPTTSGSDTIAFYPHPLVDGKDVTGHGHDGTWPLTAPAQVTGTDRFGKVQLTGEGITVLNSNGLNFTGNDSYSISAWIQLFDQPNNPIQDRIVSKSPASYPPHGYELGISLGRNIGAFVSDSIGNHAVAAWGGLTDTSSPSAWHMVTMVVKARTSVSLYIDSILSQTNTTSASAMAPNVGNDTTPLLMGGYGYLLDDVLILHHAVSANEVAARFHEGGWYAHHDTTVVPPLPDSGWSRKPGLSGTNQDLLVGQFVNATVGFVAGSNGVFLKTTDAGNTWSLRSPVPVSGTVYGISFFSATNGFAVGDQRTIAATFDGGGTWASINTSNVPVSDLIRSVCFSNQNTGFVGTADAYGAPSGSICRSTDGGTTWNPIFTTQGGIYNIDFNIPGSNGMIGVAQGRFGVSYWTNDGGATWNQGTTDQPNVIITRSTFTSPTTGFAVATNITDTIRGFILRTDDAGHTWHTVTSSWIFGNCGIANNGNGVITAVGFGGAVVESTDGGSTWVGTTSGTSRWFAVQYPTPHRAVFVGMNGNIATRDR